MKRHKKTEQEEQERFEAATAGNVVVKIYRRQRGKYSVFEVADYSTGRRRLRSFADHAEAVKEANRLAGLLAAGEATAAQIRGPEAASFGRALELLRPTGTSLELACAHYAEAFKILGGDRIIEAAKFFASRDPSKRPNRTVAEVKDEIIAQREAGGRAARSLSDLRSRLGKFAEAFQTDISSVTTGDVQRWLDGLKKKPQTVANYRRVVGGMFVFAERRGYIERGTNPVTFTERVETKRRGRIAIYTPEEFGKLLEAAADDFKPYIALGGLAGLRSTEIERLEWREISVASGHIEVAAEKSKTASRRLVPICPSLAAWLAPYANSTGRVWPKTSTDARDARKATAKAAGVPWKPNALRHSYLSYRLAEVQSAAQVALEAGNSAQMLFRHYRELVRPAEATLWFAITPEVPENVVEMKGKVV